MPRRRGWPVPAQTTRRQAAQVIAALRAGTIPLPGSGIGGPQAAARAWYAGPVPARAAGGWQAPGAPRLIVTPRPGVTPVRQYRPVQGVPLQPSNAQATASSTVTATPALVQSASGAGTASPVAVTLAPTTAGSALVVCVSLAQGTTRPQVSAITLGGGGTFVRATGTHSATGPDNEIWYALGIAGGQTALSVAFSGGTGTNPGAVVRALEISGIETAGALDGFASTDSGASTSWNSPDASTAAAAEIAVGCVGAFLSGSGTTITGPASPWTNLAQVNQGTIVSGMAGYQVLSSVQAAIHYAGTFSGSKAWAAAIATFTAAVSGVAGNAQCQLGPSGLGNVWYPTQVTLATGTGIAAGFDNSTANLYLGPVVSNATLLGSVFGGNGIVAAALPPIQPGQFLIAQWTGAGAGDTCIMNIQGTMDALI